MFTYYDVCFVVGEEVDNIGKLGKGTRVHSGDTTDLADKLPYNIL